MKCQVLVTLAALVEAKTFRDPNFCNKSNLRKADLCGEKLFFVGKNSRPFPSTEQELGKYCSQTTNLVQCVKRYTDKCANDVQRNLANVMLYTVRGLHKNTCGSKSKRKNLIVMSKCVNGIRKKSTDCMNSMLVEFGQANELNDQQYKVPYACCAFHKMKTCLMDVANKHSACDEKPIEQFENYISQMAGNTLELLCSEYDSESDKCNQVKNLAFDERKVKVPASLLKAFGNLLLGQD